jgi:hypothetical protein
VTLPHRQPRKLEMQSVCEEVWRLHTLSMTETTGRRALNGSLLSHKLVRRLSACSPQVVATFADAVIPTVLFDRESASVPV